MKCKKGKKCSIIFNWGCKLLWHISERGMCLFNAILIFYDTLV